ncbi:MAG TPA: MerR family transcriptional regulator [Firmicutes bacterium]|nr:MerR family transcriptional regulator [Bacillota bacterium]
MEYTVKELSEMAGVSPRTLRYYDQIGLLKPARTNPAGYRLYGPEEVDRLQQILFYRELGVRLGEIQEILAAPTFNAVKVLHQHREKLLAKRRQLDRLIANVEKTIAAKEGRIKMTDQEKFEAFKEKLIAENEGKYGKEARQKYGNDSVDEANEKLMKMTKEDYDRMTSLEKEMRETLAEAFKTGDPAGKEAQRAAHLHRQWLSYFWPRYSKEAHAGLARMYVDDERFTAYYDQEQPGTAAFLRDAILIYTRNLEE